MINTFFNSDNSERGIPQLKGNPKKEGTGEMNDPNEINKRKTFSLSERWTYTIKESNEAKVQVRVA